jgi:hypothetical protein
VDVEKRHCGIAPHTLDRVGGIVSTKDAIAFAVPIDIGEARSLDDGASRLCSG